MIDEVKSDIHEEKQQEEELSVKEAVLRQDVERLKCLATNNGELANENEEKRLKSHQESLEKAEK